MSDAVLSDDGVYRFSLARGDAWPSVCWVMLNPSTADATHDDPTIRRVMGFTRAWRFGSARVVNLFAYRATDPRTLLKADNPIGLDNDAHIRANAQVSIMTVLAWGAIHPKHWDRAQHIIDILTVDETPLFCLGRTQGGFPKHPLYVPSVTKPQSWSYAGPSLTTGQ